MKLNSLPLPRSLAAGCWPVALIVLALLVAPSRSLNAQPLDNLLYAAGTTITDAQQRPWSFLLWQATTPELLKDRTFAVYGKPGDADAAAPYERRAIVRLTTDPTAINVLLTRSIQLGENLPELEEHLNTLFQKLMPPQGVSLPEKLSIVIRSSLATPEYFRNLVMLSRVHPGVCLCLGFGHSELIPPGGKMTYEIRQFDFLKNTDLAVVGRVTVQAGAPVILPAPGAPVAVPETPVATSAKGDLNAKFRWAAPDALRRLSLLGYGFNLYRVTTNYAITHNYHLIPPGPGVLAQLARQFSANTTNPPVRLVNLAPVLKSKDFDFASVANFNTNSPTGDATTYFVHDDNRRYAPGGRAFENGERFYYFVAARDILGRDGFASPGTLVTMCDRLPPEAPQQVQVENDYVKQLNQAAVQKLKVSWKQNTDTPSERHMFYYVYRWSNNSDYLHDTLDPVNHPNLIGPPIPALAGLDRLSIVDNGPGSPSMPADAGKTFWYTVRVVDDGACGGNYSPHTGPIFGVLRDRTGPGSPSGVLGIQCCQPVVTLGENRDLPFTADNPAYAYFRPTCDRDSAAIEWAEFYAFQTGPSNLIKRVYFNGSSQPVSVDFSVLRAQLGANPLPVFCRVGTASGQVSAFRAASVSAPTVDTIRVVSFKSLLDCRKTLVGPTSAERCDRHEPNPDGTGTNDCIEMTINVQPGTREIKVYKRVDFGGLTLIQQGKVTNNPVKLVDCTPLANPGNVCYFVQAFDENGNASAMTPIGSCIPVAGTTKPVKPILSPLAAFGSAASPVMDITWFCPPYGVERFEISIAVEGNATMPTNISAELSTAIRTDPDVNFKVNGKVLTDDFAVYQTRVVGPGFGEGAKFRVSVGIELGKTYYVFVRAVMKDGKLSDRSNVEDFYWSEPSVPGPQVPWPDRPLPSVQPVFNAGVAAVVLPDAFYPVGIRIGAGLPVLGVPTNGFTILQGTVSPLSYLFPRNGSGNVLPVALYRYQVPNAEFPNVSGDVTQVSPLMEKIAYQHTTIAPYGQVTVIRDPFVGIYRSGETAGPPTFQMYLLDTQPVITGARYGYLLVRFGENREIEEVIATNEVQP